MKRYGLLGIVRYVQEGERYPFGYGLGWYDCMRWRIVAFPLGVNVLMRLAYATWISLLRAWPRRPLWLERLQCEADRRARERVDGKVDALRHEIDMMREQRDATQQLLVRSQRAAGVTMKDATEGYGVKP